MGDTFPGKPAGADYAENLSGGRVQTAGNERAGGKIPQDHHESADHAAQFRYDHGSDRLRRRGAGCYHGGHPVCGGAASPCAGCLLHHPAVGGLFPSHAAAGLLLPHCHERHGRQRQNLPPAGSARAGGRDRQRSR